MFDDWKVTVVRIRAGDGGIDQYDEPVPGEDERVALPDALFAPTPTDLPIEAGTDATVTSPTLYWPDQWPDIKSGDRLEVDGAEWRVDGRPARWPLGLSVSLIGAHRKETS
ncbi:hypothetical protein EG850_10975 [Gulosibacter macacae]|uniref:Phage protein n=1 Tax=Gulosibacter macacae TaxID=2488791 RepID=A0A3P3VTX6_9MICO|nr:hypothetical protein [Gulosibacter macacae]RRJ85904.1 hypothetical protein EG850_10975 [Gulosibacter macacae]